MEKVIEKNDKNRERVATPFSIFTLSYNKVSKTAYYNRSSNFLYIQMANGKVKWDWYIRQEMNSRR